MRLLSNEHKDIAELLSNHGLADEVLPTKKKGWVHLSVRGNTFSFHRKKVAQLVDGQLSTSFQYYIRQGSKSVEVPDWEAVKVALERFLAQKSAPS